MYNTKRKTGKKEKKTGNAKDIIHPPQSAQGLWNMVPVLASLPSTCQHPLNNHLTPNLQTPTPTQHLNS
jgi:hypothetical protein